MKVLAVNKKAKFDYEFLETYQAGIVLFGHEVKAAKNGHINLKGSYISADNNELYLKKCTISAYKKASKLDDYDPQRNRKLLLHKRQIAHIIGKLQEKGLTIVPVKVYTSNNKLKVEFAVAKGKKKYDKRETIKQRDVKRRIDRTLKQY